MCIPGDLDKMPVAELYMEQELETVEIPRTVKSINSDIVKGVVCSNKKIMTCTHVHKP